jgi:hypothetical protein
MGRSSAYGSIDSWTRVVPANQAGFDGHFFCTIPAQFGCLSGLVSTA